MWNSEFGSGNVEVGPVVVPKGRNDGAARCGRHEGSVHGEKGKGLDWCI